MKLNRRGFLAAAGLGALSGSGDGADLTKMIVHSARPADLEMPLDGFDAVDHASRPFLRALPHLRARARRSVATWKLNVDGEVNQPLALTMDDLKKLPRVEQVSVLECAGNGRSFYQPHVAGTQWAFGSVGNGRWTGVRFRDVLAKAGLKDSARHILLDGTDVAARNHAQVPAHHHGGKSDGSRHAAGLRNERRRAAARITVSRCA